MSPKYSVCVTLYTSPYKACVLQIASDLFLNSEYTSIPHSSAWANSA